MRLIDADALIKWINESRCADCPDKQDERCAACQWDDAIMSIETAPTIGGWISVKDRLPESNEEVLAAVYDLDGQAYHTLAVHYPCGDWDSDDDYFNMNEDKVMYWMPLPTLPEPPKEVTGDAD